MSVFSRNAIGAALAFVCLFTTVETSGQTIGSSVTIQETLLHAETSGKPIAVYMYSEEWDAPAKLWDVLPEHPAIEQYINRFLLVEVDAQSENGKAWADRYNVIGLYPSLALLDSEGILLGYTALQDPELVSTMSFLLTTEMYKDSRSNGR